MKRRIGSARRQVLDLEVRESSPRRSWKNKYQQVAGDHNSYNDEPASASTDGGRLLNLVGYKSESDGEEDKQPANALDSQVNDFLKEIHSLNPPTAPSSKMDTADPTNCPWQLCYDESSGYPYYWNTVTNAVTWEPPPEVVAMQSAMAADTANSDWAVEKAALGLPPRSNANLVPKPTVSTALTASQDVIKKRLAPNNKDKKPNGKRRSKRNYNSDDEKIEMITSWADEDSEDEETAAPKKPKKPPEVKKPVAKPPVAKRPAPPESKSNEVIGPHLPPDILKHRRILDGLVSSRRNQAAAEEPDDDKKSQLLEKLRRLKAESNEPEEAREKVLAPGIGHQSSRSSRSRSNSPGNHERRHHKGPDGEDENRMITHLKKHAQLFKELSDIPESSDAEKSAAKDPVDIIKLIEMEQPPDHNKTVKTKTETPSSIALIAGYGDDSDGDDTEANEDTVTKPAPTPPLFPIMQHSADIQSFVENLKVVKAEEKLEVRDVPEVKPSFNLESNPLLESVGGVKRKKRLAVPTRLCPVKNSDDSESKSPEPVERTSKSCVVLGNISEGEKSVSASEYSMKWSSSYVSDPSSGERRGFGFQDSSEQSSELQKGKVLFVKAETMNERDPSSDDSKKPGLGKDSFKSFGRKNAESKEALTDMTNLNSLASLVTEKIQFLIEGRGSVEPVQVMSIQVETLMTAWQTSALDDSYFARWLECMETQLAELEKKAAPEGWDVHWDRTYKRYFYWNSTTNVTQWEYPIEASKAEADTQKSSPSKEVSTSAVDEDAMEICTTPPPDEMEHGSFNIQVAAPPVVTAPTPPSEPPKTRESTSPTDKLGDRIASNTPKQEAPPPPPLPSSPPPLPPPPETPPPPLPPSAPPVAAVPGDTHGEPLPPGVDTPDLPYVVARPTVSASRVAALHGVGGTALATPYAAVGSYPVMPTAEAVLAAYAPVAMTQPLQYVDYREPYMATVPASVTAPPYTYTAPAPMPVPPEKTALMSELSSFYSDLALIKSEESEKPQESVSAPAPVVSAPHPPVEPEKPAEVVLPPEDKVVIPSTVENRPTVSHPSPTSTAEPTETTVRKKKKSKLIPGLALKKKGVSNLVAKWQQVRQEVWKDYQDLDNGDDSSGPRDENDGCDNTNDR